MSKNCKKNIKKCREAVKNRQKSRKTVNKLSTMLTNCKKNTQICRNRVKKQSSMLKNCKKPLKNIEKPSNMSKIRGKPSKVT